MKDLKEHFPCQWETVESIKFCNQRRNQLYYPEEISSVFKEHFISIADNIIDETINTEPDLTSLVDFVRRNKADNSAEFSITTISDREVLEIVKSLPSNVATGLDGISYDAPGPMGPRRMSRRPPLILAQAFALLIIMKGGELEPQP